MTINTKFEMGQEVYVNVYGAQISRAPVEKGKITMIRVFLASIDIDYEIETAERWIIRPECYIYETEQAAHENREKEYYAINYDYNKARRK